MTEALAANFLTVDFNTATGDEIRETAQGVEYYRNNVLHRDGGPAIECKNGDRHWYDNGMRHRVEGPAVELAKGGKEWWVKAIKMSEDEHIHFRHWQKQRDMLAAVAEAETVPVQGVPEAISLMRPLRFKMSNV
ncbi:MAG: hypothetical protein EPN97_13270 [Alphaproteobacteria bacterium]|nr:MAG: hypothetical protein EPN97_13270 [Alphaproteobacteria bacterium]